MSLQNTPSSSFQVYVRWRPLGPSESSTPEVERSVTQHEMKQSIALSAQSGSNNRPRTWKSGATFAHVFQETAINKDVFETVIAPTLPQVMEGATCNIFAYGHSGSGKTHTIIGYDYEEDQHLGLCFAAARHLFDALAEIREKGNSDEGSERDKEQLGIAVRLYEVRGKSAHDLLNSGSECHVREGPDGRTHIRGQTEMLEGGKVRVRPIVAVPCSSFDELRETVRAGLEMRKTGSSSVHDESSRTHAILELEVINKPLLEARDAVIEKESELVPVGKRATDIYLDEHKKTLIRTADGGWAVDPECVLDQPRIDAAEAEKKGCETELKAAKDAVTSCFKTCKHTCLGGKLVFLDLAGSEYFDQGSGASFAGVTQTVQERQQGRQINSDLFALKEVIRAKASNQARIPYRSSPLTMVLRSHFSATNKGRSAMILTVSPSETQFAATTNTLKYGNLVGVAGESA